VPAQALPIQAPVVFGPPPEAPRVVRAFKKIVRWFFEVGFPQTAALVIPARVPPLTILEAAREFSIAVTPVRLTIVESAVVLTFGGPVVTRKQGSTYVINFTLQDANGAVDLTGSTVQLSMRDRHTAVNKITSAGVTVLVPATGSCRYVIQAADVNTASDYEILVTENRADGTIAKYPSEGYEPLSIEPSF
jgi:hypothetical protein